MISLMHGQDIDLFGNIIVKLINIKLFDLLTCCHYIVNPRAGPRDVVAGGALKAEVLNRAAEAARFRREGGGVGV